METQMNFLFYLGAIPKLLPYVYANIAKSKTLLVSSISGKDSQPGLAG
jgi:hypothetical protein